MLSRGVRRLPAGTAAAARPTAAAERKVDKGCTIKSSIKKRAGTDALRKAAIMFQYERLELHLLDSFPDVPKGKPKQDAPLHVARTIAVGLVKKGERPPDTSWVLGILRDIRAVRLF